MTETTELRIGRRDVLKGASVVAAGSAALATPVKKAEAAGKPLRRRKPMQRRQTR